MKKYKKSLASLGLAFGFAFGFSSMAVAGQFDGVTLKVATGRLWKATWKK